MTRSNGTRGKIFSGKLHPGFWVLGISLLTAGVHNALSLTGDHSLLIPLAVGAALGTGLFAYTHRHRKHVRGLHKKGAAIRKSEVKYRTFFENSADAMLIIENGTFVDCNAAAAATLGYDRREELLLVHPSELSPEFQPDGRSSAEKADEMMQKARERGSLHFEWEHLREDGAVVPMEVSLTAIPGDGGAQLHTVWRDLTDRKKVEKSLLEKEEKFRGLVESSSDWIWEVNAEYVYTYSSPQVERILGYTPEEIVGKTPSDLMTPEEDERTRKIFYDAAERGEPIVSVENVNLHKDGREVVLETSGVPVLDEAGNVTGYRGVDRDITSKREMESQYRQAQKMEAVGLMAGGIAHDFNNLLQVISGYAELSEASLSPENPAASSVREIGKAASRAKELIDQLLAFSRRKVIRPVDLNLNALIDPLLKMIQGLIGEHIQLEFIPGHGLGTVHADGGQIEQILMNLCVNARDAMQKGGMLTIETENVLIDHEYAQTHSWATEGRCILLRVSDTGSGMDSETRERVFEPFFTTKGVGEGSGLGLSMVFGIIEQHHGHVEVYSELDQGTIFKIYLPVVERRAVEVSRTVSPVVADGTETLLIAEDDEAVLELTQYILIEAGYTVLTAKDGKEAVRVFETRAAEIDMVMFDVVMPRMGGKEAMEHILKKRPDLPHLFASGYSENAVHTNFIQNRGLHLLSKPYQTDSLLRKIREVLDEK